MSIVQAILFDVDGTLIDSNDAHARAWVGALRAHGYDITFEQVRPLIGMGGDKILPDLVGLDPESAQARLITETRSTLFRRELPHLEPTRGARALLELLRREGLELVVATSAQESEVRAILEQAGVADLFSATSSSDDAEQSKPDPDIVLAALRKARKQAAHSLMIGDTPYDIEAAGRARVPAIALRCGGWWTDDAFRDALAIYDDPADLCEHYSASLIATWRASRTSDLSE
jgi:HAD superfamily hydrolase (TIGR01509 family)